jgi:hypothetical protein
MWAKRRQPPRQAPPPPAPLAKVAGRVTCRRCGRVVGLCWFGKEVHLVDPQIVQAAGDGPDHRPALLLHRCPGDPGPRRSP